MTAQRSLIATERARASRAPARRMKTIRDMKEARAGKLRSFQSIEALMIDLKAKD